MGNQDEETREEQASEAGPKEESDLDFLLRELSVAAKDALVRSGCKICVTLDDDVYGLAVVLANDWLIPIENIDRSSVRAEMVPTFDATRVANGYERAYNVKLAFRDLGVGVGKNLKHG